jgi:hypothetical protein
LKYKCRYFVETIDPHSRNLEEEELLEDIIKDAPDVEPTESPSSYLNPSGDGMEVGRHEDEADGEGDGWRVVDDAYYRQAVGEPQAEGMMSTAGSFSLS